MKIKVATVSMACEYRSPASVEDNLSYIENLLKDISNIKPDIIALPEIFPYVGLPIKARDVKDTDKIKRFMSDLARRYDTYLAGSTYDRKDEKIYNSILVFDRKGELIGKYDKIHPTEPEMEDGVFPGAKDQKPIDTEFGKIGCQICFDANWSSFWKYQVDNDAKLIIFSSAYPGGRMLNSIATLFNVFIVASTWGLKSGIIDKIGRWRVKTDRFSYWVWDKIELDTEIFHWDFQHDKPLKILERYGDKVRIESFEDEALFLVEPFTEDIRIEDLIKEFNLLTYRNYIARAEKNQDDRR
ncbi:MAG: carbon-nitrogen hydrolase family protein [bacterium]|nr:carbon-nitrogen hydrolase family protein [bacterium]